MKMFKLFRIALLAVLVCVNFASCSSSDDNPMEEESPQYELVTSGKKLAKVEYTLSDSSSDFFEVWDFSYDGEGKLVEASFTKSNGNQTKNSYTWNNDVIDVHQKIDYKNGYTNDEEYEFSYNLKNGLVQDNDIKYDETRRPSEIMGSTIMWDEDMLNRRSTPFQVSENQKKYDFIQYYYKENGMTCSGYNPFIPLELMSDTDFLFIAHPEIAGIRTTQIPVSFLDQDVLGGMTQGTYSHRLDNEGYILEFRIKYNDGRGEDVYQMTWK